MVLRLVLLVHSVRTFFSLHRSRFGAARGVVLLWLRHNRSVNVLGSHITRMR